MSEKDKSDNPGTGIGDAVGGVVDGALKFVGVKEGGLNGFSERLGVALAVAIPTVFAYARFAVKPAVVKSKDAELIVSSIPLGRMTMGKI